MNTRKISLGVAVAILTSVLFMSSAYAADGWLNLPATPVTMEISMGVDSTFFTTLSNVPVGYDVANGDYPGWCVDRRFYYPAPPPATHEVVLYSSYYPPMDLTGEQWDMVNYILNHKQGTAWDVQEAIWYFIDLVGGTYIPGSTEGKAMVSDALANGAGYVPGSGEVITVICYPVEPTQISIIELVKHEYEGGFTIGYWKNHPKAWPVESITIGGVTYTKTQALDILWNTNAKDATLMLAAQLIGAKLNVLNGANPSIQPTIDNADAFLSAHPIGSSLTKAERAYALELKDMLDMYNNGY